MLIRSTIKEKNRINIPHGPRERPVSPLNKMQARLKVASMAHGYGQAIQVSPQTMELALICTLLSDEARSSTSRIAQRWFDRWATTRTGCGDMEQKLLAHTLVRPIRHGARIVLLGDDTIISPSGSTDRRAAAGHPRPDRPVDRSRSVAII
jgi:hypothetical protein